MVIYKATNKINDKSYIGQTTYNIKKRSHEHIKFSEHGSNTVFHKAIRKYGKENFEWELLRECNSIDELNKEEQHYIKKYDTFISNGNGYNMTVGGKNNVLYLECPKCNTIGGYGNMIRWHFDNCGKHQKQKEVECSKCGKIGGSSNMKRYHFDNCGLGPTKEYRAKLRKAHLGKKLSEEHKSNIGKSNRGIKYDIVKCPHCNKEGGLTGMKSWHFNNCKEINNGY